MKRLFFALVLLSGCAGSLQEAKVTKVEQVTVDTAVELCVLAHGVNEQTNTGAKLDEVRDKIDAVCMPALKAMMTVEGLDIAKAVAQLQAALKEVLQ